MSHRRRDEIRLTKIPLPSYEFARSDGVPLMEHTRSGPLPRNDPDGFDVQATDTTRAMARRILDEVVEKLGERGCSIQLGVVWKPHGTFVRWKKGIVQMLIREKTKMTRIDRAGDRWAPRIIYVPTWAACLQGRHAGFHIDRAGETRRARR